MGDPKDLIFAFDAKGRPPQDMTIQVVTPVSFTVEYSDAPIDKIGVVEVNAHGELQGLLRDREQGNGVHLAVGPAIERQAARTALPGLAKPARSLIRPPPATAPVGG